MRVLTKYCLLQSFAIAIYHIQCFIKEFQRITECEHYLVKYGF